MATINISLSFFSDSQDIDDAVEVLNLIKKRIALRTQSALHRPEAAAGEKAEPVAVEPKITEAVSGEMLRKAAAAKAKQIGSEKVKAFVKGLGVKTIIDVAPEDAPGVLAQLQALQ